MRSSFINKRTASAPYQSNTRKGDRKPHRAYEVQLCAQALCLKSMLGHEVPKGFLFYGKARGRMEVVFNSELLELTGETAIAARTMIAAGNRA